MSNFTNSCRLKADAGALNNFEVLEFLKSKGYSKDDRKRAMGRVTTSEYKVVTEFVFLLPILYF